MTPCRWCAREAVTSTVTVARGTEPWTIAVSYLCDLHDAAARVAQMQDEIRRDCGMPRIDAVIADVRVVAS